MRIELTESEMVQGAFAGVQRHVFAVIKGISPKYNANATGTAWDKNIEGALGEMAAAKWANRYWSGKGEVGQLDVGSRSGFEVRSTARPDGCLILHEADHDDKKFVLITGADGIYNVHGYITAKEGKQEKFWRTNVPAPAFFVPQGALHEL